MTYQLDDLLYLMARLRHPQHGCPWDLQQNFASIVPHTLEEAYEVADAIEQGDFSQLSGELGDLLFQVVYYAQLGQEEGRFTWGDIVDGITRKLVRRHPHVFPDGNLRTPPGALSLAPEQIKQRWEQIKAEERAEKAGAPEQLSLLDDVPQALPSLSRAQKLQKRAASAGFDWPEAAPVVDKIAEELDEVRAALRAGDQAAVAEEMGDLLFCVVNLARHLGVDAEYALREGNNKFERRFRYIEKQLQACGKRVEHTELSALDALWDQAKAQGL
ncbi:MAG: nucleoside triphosphate pyrophosphohydrolase [Halopseudomonas sp.]|uniref:nucleoside triphosphate pyrophosphohydrolase n=1 Tax=Halopseudomonas sp. TaxID=2901191 RepID=UPI003002E8F6